MAHGRPVRASMPDDAMSGSMVMGDMSRMVAGPAGASLGSVRALTAGRMRAARRRGASMGGPVRDAARWRHGASVTLFDMDDAAPAFA
ncbi:MAG: hypothetical protein AAFX09_05500 [Pseudomonadota bacterium]